MVFVTPFLLSGRAAAQMNPPIRITVDLKDAPRGIVHIEEFVPLSPGDHTLVFPKWIPGAHGPDGPIDSIADFYVHPAGGSSTEAIPWRRDLVDLFAIHTRVPDGANGLRLNYDYLRFGTANHGTLEWTELEWLPEGYNQNTLMLSPTIQLPSGWKQASSMTVDGIDGDSVRYKTVSLVDLNEHPVITGKYLREMIIFPASSPYGEHAIDVAADKPSQLEWPEARLGQMRNIVEQERAVFGGVGHYTKYHWLLSVSQYGGFNGLEHNECSDDGDGPDFMTNDNQFRNGDLLTHEFCHSWNGKSWRPAGLNTGDFQKPMKDNLLWSYEGMTQFYGQLIPARAGLITEEEFAQKLANTIAGLDTPGRKWRPLQDTADDASHTYGLRGTWGGQSRGADYYFEDVLNWLNVDAIIRKGTNNKKSLDDYARIFEGRGGNGKVFVQSYHEQDIYDYLNKVYPYDWAKFWHDRLQKTSDFPPVEGITLLGWKFEYSNTPPEGAPAGGRFGGGLNFDHGAGFSVGGNGTVSNVWIGSPAWKAGLGPNMEILAINGAEFSAKGLREALEKAHADHQPITLKVSNQGEESTLTLDYDGGILYPHLVRIPGTPDLLKEVTAPRPIATFTANEG